MADKMGSMSGSIVTQRAVSYVQDEYKAQGIDPADVQNAYLSRMATTMFGLCTVSLVATILTGAVASRTACSIARDLRRETFNKVMHFSPAEVGKFSQPRSLPAAPTTFSRSRWPQPCLSACA